MSTVVKRIRRAYRRFTKIESFYSLMQDAKPLVLPMRRARTSFLKMIDPGRKSGGRPQDKCLEARCTEVLPSAHRLSDPTASKMCQLTDAPACRRTLVSECETTCNSWITLEGRA